MSSGWKQHPSQRKALPPSTAPQRPQLPQLSWHLSQTPLLTPKLRAFPSFTFLDPSMGVGKTCGSVVKFTPQPRSLPLQPPLFDCL